mgnify:CR=1 FL=1
MKSDKKVELRRINLSQIKDPKFLNELSYEELELLSNDIRNEIILKTSNYGGHLSSNLGVVELTIALHRVFDLSKDKLIFDVGHQCYTHKILTGRSLEGLRTKDGVSGFQKINESPYDCFEAGHSSTSISAANGFAIARDLNKEKYNVIAVVGDSSIVNGLAFEALNNLGQSNHKTIVIINDNGMSISKPIGGMSKMFAKVSTGAGYNKVKHGYEKIMTKTKVGTKIYNFTFKVKNWFKNILRASNMFTEMNFAYLGPIDGHNIKAIEKALLRSNNTKKSVIIHVCTTKGKGYKFAENDNVGKWHGVTPFDIESGEPKTKDESKTTWSTVLSNICYAKMEEHPKSILICPATEVGSDLNKIFKKYPERCMDVGIAEEHAATLAGSLSINGYHPIVSIYSTFMQRAYDEISHDIARMHLNATFIVDRSGLVGSDGDTHQGIYDESFISTIPGCIVTMPSNEEEAEALFEESFKNHGPFFIRIPRTPLFKREAFRKCNIDFGKWIKLQDSVSKKLAIVGVGPLLRTLHMGVLGERLDCAVYNALYCNIIDEKCVSELLEYENIVIYDPYSTRLGIVNILMAHLLEKNYKGAVSAYFVDNTFVSHATINEQLEKFGLLPEQVILKIKNK